MNFIEAVEKAIEGYNVTRTLVLLSDDKPMILKRKIELNLDDGQDEDQADVNILEKVSIEKGSYTNYYRTVIGADDVLDTNWEVKDDA